MLLSRPTPAQLAAVFEKVATMIALGDLVGCPTDTGLDSATVAALNEIVHAEDKAAALGRARKVFAAAGKS